MIKRVYLLLIVISGLLLLASCSKRTYYVNDYEGNIISIEASELDGAQRRAIAKLESGEYNLSELLQTGRFSAQELVKIGIVKANEEDGSAIIDTGSMIGVPLDADPNLIIKVMAGEATDAEIEILIDSGMTQEEIDNLKADYSHDRSSYGDPEISEFQLPPPE